MRLNSRKVLLFIVLKKETSFRNKENVKANGVRRKEVIVENHVVLASVISAKPISQRKRNAFETQAFCWTKEKVK